jgi:hypothetical protein
MGMSAGVEPILGWEGTLKFPGMEPSNLLIDLNAAPQDILRLKGAEHEDLLRGEPVAFLEIITPVTVRRLVLVMMAVFGDVLAGELHHSRGVIVRFGLEIIRVAACLKGPFPFEVGRDFVVIGDFQGLAGLRRTRADEQNKEK